MTLQAFKYPHTRAHKQKKDWLLTYMLCYAIRTPCLSPVDLCEGDVARSRERSHHRMPSSPRRSAAGVSHHQHGAM